LAPTVWGIIPIQFEFQFTKTTRTETDVEYCDRELSHSEADDDKAAIAYSSDAESCNSTDMWRCIDEDVGLRRSLGKSASSHRDDAVYHPLPTESDQLAGLEHESELCRASIAHLSCKLAKRSAEERSTNQQNSTGRAVHRNKDLSRRWRALSNSSSHARSSKTENTERKLSAKDKKPYVDNRVYGHGKVGVNREFEYNNESSDPEFSEQRLKHGERRNKRPESHFSSSGESRNRSRR